MPMSDGFRQRLTPNLPQIAAHFGTPFHIYDETGIRQTVRTLFAAFDGLPFREFFAVKALPNPHILRILAEEGCGFDCSSVPELVLARQIGAPPQNILFTSNNTTSEEFAAALADGGSWLNLDDAALLARLPRVPDAISFRMNPGSETGNTIIGRPEEAKFGIPREALADAYRAAQALGIQRFGLHQMVVSNERDAEAHLASVALLCDVARQIQEMLGHSLDFINIGGGLGIPYRPDDAPLNLGTLATGIRALWSDFPQTQLFMESGRYVTGPHGVLVTRVINRKTSYRQYVGVDASMSALMRPGMYGAYHHVDVLGAPPDSSTEVVDVVGSLCENNDKFAVQRALPITQPGDLLLIQDTGAHGHSMGFNYNGRLRPQELLLRADGRVERIRRAETLDDYFATLHDVDAALWQNP
ncbi:diaminopimelate decarboxylase [Phototrophicus methaneseepsis]|uniref:Diaminopimelate decarboxylase n=1 Tax=Phototrophicus methaneseepsis TaxID=2710758 RepID=A0A7S8EB64_9CHLR|nr:diaminopimelate decarboxylase [Phototrophicus methaneseepsis]